MKTVLIVDDMPTNQLVLRHLVKKFCDLDTQTANNGKRAVELFENAPDDYAMIFMDIQMPIMDGIEATTKIRESEARSNTATTVPIVALTAYGQQFPKEECLEAGVDLFLEKPVSNSKIENALKQFGI